MSQSKSRKSNPFTLIVLASLFAFQIGFPKFSATLPGAQAASVEEETVGIDVIQKTFTLKTKSAKTSKAVAKAKVVKTKKGTKVVKAHYVSKH